MSTAEPADEVRRGARRRIEAAAGIVRDAGALALRHFHDRDKLRITEKGLQDQTTNADLAVESLLMDRLAALWPEDRLLGEETGGARGAAGRFGWVIDPIDGTQCFLSGIPVWCVSVALLDGDGLAGGLIFDPVHDELFVALGGLGATLNGRVLAVNPATSVKHGVVGVGFSHRTGPEPAIRFIGELAARGGMFQRNGSGALMLAYVAAGRLLGYVEAHINAWDCLAGIALIEEAGGICNLFLEHDGLVRGGPLLGFAAGVADELREVATRAGLETSWPTSGK